MNIAIIAFDLPGEAKGGVAYVVHYLANGLVAKGHRVSVFTTSPEPRDGKYKVRQIKMPAVVKRFAWLKTALFPFFAALKDYSEFDVLHAHGDNQFIFTKTPSVRTLHGSAMDEALHATTLFRFLYQLFYVYPFEVLTGLRTSRNIVVSKKVGLRYPFKTQTIYGGADLNIFKPGQKAQNPVILYVGGSITGRKRGQMLLDIFKEKIIKEIPDAELWIVSSESVQGKGIKSFYCSLSTEKIAELYQKAWLFCLPSAYEGQGLPYIEALACGCAIVSTDNSGAKEILNNGEYGTIVKAQNLSDTIVSLLRDKAKREKYETKGLKRAQEFSLEKTINSYIDVYKNILNLRKP